MSCTRVVVLLLLLLSTPDSRLWCLIKISAEWSGSFRPALFVWCVLYYVACVGRQAEEKSVLGGAQGGKKLLHPDFSVICFEGGSAGGVESPPEFDRARQGPVRASPAFIRPAEQA